MEPADERKERLQKLASLFPVTMTKLNEDHGFGLTLRQMELQGYLDWEIIQAACNLVARYRIDKQASLSAQELGTRLRAYFAGYHETEDSPYPPPGFFNKRALRRQALADRVARMTRIVNPPLGASFAQTEVEPTAPEPKNLAYSKQGTIHGWKILFYDLMTGSYIHDVFLQVITEDAEAVFEVAENLSRAIAADAGLIWNWLNESKIKNREPVVISVHEESSFSRLFPDAYKTLLKDGQLTDRLPIAVGAARKKNGTLGVRIVLKDNLPDRDDERTKSLVLKFALYGAVYLLCGKGKAEALDASGSLVRSL
jgi:hypothetical protein